jgi:aspartate/methionine/tyrosine aminotransferase
VLILPVVTKKCHCLLTSACISDVERYIQVDVMVTAGANQAFTNLVCALLDAEDAAVLFSPYYFNHLMALQARCTRSLAQPSSRTVRY